MGGMGDMGAGEVAVDLADHRPDVYEEGGKWVYRASSFGGSCLGSLVRSAVGVGTSSPPDVIQRAYDFGAANEHVVIDEFSRYHGWRMLGPTQLENRYGWGSVKANGQVELDLPVPGGVIRCHPDGVAKCYRIDDATREKYENLPYALGDTRVVEVKTVAASMKGQNLFEKYPNWPWQLSVEMGVTKLPAIYVVAWKEDGELIRLDDGRLDLTVAYYSTPPYSLGAMKKRVAEIARAVRAHGDGAGFPACDVKQWPCGHWEFHDKVEGIWAKPDLLEIDDEEIIRLAQEVADLGDASVKKAEEYNEARARLLELMGDREPGSYKVGEIKVTRVKRQNRSLDKAAVCKALGMKDLEPYMKDGKVSDYVTIEPIVDGRRTAG